MSLAHSPSIVTKNLVMCFDAGDPKSYPLAGTTWKDRSTKSLDATLLASVSFDSANSGGLSFNGAATSYAFTDHNSDFNMDTNSSIEVIFKGSSSLTAASDSRQTLWSNSQNDSFGLEIGIFTGCGIGGTTSDGFRFLMHRQGNCFSAASNANAYVQNAVTQFVYTRDGSRNEKMYTNGIEIPLAVENNHTFAAGSSSSYIGVRGTSLGQKFQGKIYAIRMYTKELNASEVSQNFKAVRGRYGI